MYGMFYVSRFNAACLVIASLLVGLRNFNCQAATTCGCVVGASSILPSSSSQASPPDEPQPSAGDPVLIEGDILVSSEQLAQRFQQQQQQPDLFDASIPSSIYWPNGTVFYTLSRDYTSSEAAFIDASLRDLQLAVGNAVSFKRLTGGRVSGDYVAVRSGSGCNSYVGRQGGAQTMSIQRPQCLQKYIVQHEFIHALGFWHEHSRSDRGIYVDIWWSLIQADKCSNFGVFGSAPPTGYPAYDTASIMHYDSFAFSCDGSSATITSKTSGVIRYPVKLATSDLLRIQYYYGMGDNSTATGVTSTVRSLLWLPIVTLLVRICSVQYLGP